MEGRPSLYDCIQVERERSEKYGKKVNAAVASEPVDLEEVIEFNQQQIEHIQLHQSLIWDWVSKMMQDVLIHDKTKFAKSQYAAFVQSRQSLNQSKDGKDKEYQKHLNSASIQEHIHSEVHHPEYWDDKGFDTMPVRCAIQMYYDWKSRSLQRGTSMTAFWDFNIAKLQNQPTAQKIVEHLRKEDDWG